MTKKDMEIKTLLDIEVENRNKDLSQKKERQSVTPEYFY